MENQEEKKPVPEIEQAEEATPEELKQDRPTSPEIETPRVPDADTEGIP